jgi:hypothetical protein
MRKCSASQPITARSADITRISSAEHILAGAHCEDRMAAAANARGGPEGSRAVRHPARPGGRDEVKRAVRLENPELPEKPSRDRRDQPRARARTEDDRSDLIRPAPGTLENRTIQVDTEVGRKDETVVAVDDERPHDSPAHALTAATRPRWCSSVTRRSVEIIMLDSIPIRRPQRAIAPLRTCHPVGHVVDPPAVDALGRAVRG